ncbi:MAG: aminodeoxychorismate synthase component I [Gammaproteobacteria bacterium]|nr:aminodeoxychorismate synthase component I [Gammaproteobacteria bacterium]
MATLMTENSLIVESLAGFVDLTRLHAHQPARYPYLLASTSHSTSNTSLDRYDILLGFPQSKVELWPTGLISDLPGLDETQFLHALDTAWQRERKNKPETLSNLPFHGGWFIYMGYELAAEIEPCLHLVDNETSAIPTALAIRIPLAVINDRLEHQSWLVCEPEYEHVIKDTMDDIHCLKTTSLAEDVQWNITLEEDPPENFLDGVEQVKNYIRDGDVFQVNLSRKWTGHSGQDMSETKLFNRLSKSNPSPFAGLVHFDNAAIISSSPERLVRTHKNVIETRPIAGTRPRGSNDQADKHNLEELIGHPKERAEHVMLIDLERNDLGRICNPGSICVDELMVLESYAHVHHIVSNVRGEIAANKTPGDIIRAVFPGGTITGCPKVRCMEIIAELEQTSRGPYTGAMGYLNHNGDMDLNILIRTIVMDKDKISFRAGAGLVADSIAEKELQETRAKARGMLLSLQENLQ